ncbi:restriction endonuclease [Sungkyunkwania multivorans]|uniref:Restriction endonuclease n=1 Tax=Sungkyunkwania multivorans TaxID=1173618 RepID=A0ABW3D185_9FLAO
MNRSNFKIVKASGDIVDFSFEKLEASLRRTGAEDALVSHILTTVQDELYNGISTKEVYNRAYALLKKGKSVFASKYKLKKAIYELGPSGFPFEKFVAAILKYSGYDVEVNLELQGSCVTHEIDVLAQKNGEATLVECKFHADEGRKCDVKIPLYIHSRYNDLKEHYNNKNLIKPLSQGWVVTNTRFTSHAQQYGKCVGLYLLSWDFPKENSLKARIDRLGLYPITAASRLTKYEKQFLLDRGVVLCRDLQANDFYLDHLGISDTRKENIIKEIRQLCTF